MNGSFDGATLQPAPELVGRMLAPAWRRFAAAGVDALLLVVPTAIIATLAAIAFFAVRFPSVTAVVMDEDRTNASNGVVLDFLLDHHREGLPPEVRCAHDLEGRDAALRVMGAKDMKFSLGLNKGSGAPSKTGLHFGTAEVPPDSQLEYRIRLVDIAPGIVVRLIQFGLAALYFAVFTSGGRRTLGKRLLGIEVVHISGRPPKLVEGYLRFMSYFITVGSGFGLLAYVREPNGRTSHDRLVNTLVLRVSPLADRPAAVAAQG